MSSIFTKIIRGEIPCYKVDETEDCLAFLDINPNSYGHTLCILKKEIDYIFDLSDEEYLSLMKFSKKIALAIKKSVDCKRVAMSVVGLEVPHVHVHLIPIYSEGGPFRLGHSIKLKKEEMRTISEQIAKHLDQ